MHYTWKVTLTNHIHKQSIQVQLKNEVHSILICTLNSINYSSQLEICQHAILPTCHLAAKARYKQIQGKKSVGKFDIADLSSHILKLSIIFFNQILFNMKKFFMISLLF